VSDGRNILSNRQQILLRHQLGHDELSRGLGVRLGMVLRYASLAQKASVGECIERKDHEQLRRNGSRKMSTLEQNKNRSLMSRAIEMVERICVVTRGRTPRPPA